jgi:hypothetical protein
MKDFEFPFATDKATNKPSVTLFFAYVSFVVALIVVVYLTYRDVVAGAASALFLFFGSLVMYRIRNLDKIKLNMSERSVELEDTPDNEDKNEA